VTAILNSVKEVHFYVLCSEELNYVDYVKNVLFVNSTVLLINHIEEVNSGYHLVLRKLHYPLKQDNFKRCFIIAISFEENMLVVASLRYCVHQQSCDLFH